jgi:hypothetical protein
LSGAWSTRSIYLNTEKEAESTLSHPRYLLDVLAGPTATAAHKNKERTRISLSLRRKIKTNPENRTEDEE